MIFTKNGSINSVADAVAQTFAWMMKKGRHKKAIPKIIECDVDEIIHPARHDAIGRDGIWCLSIEVRRSALGRKHIRKIKLLFGESRFRPVDPTFRSEEGTMKIIRASRQRLAIVPNRSAFADAILVSIGKFPNLRWCGNIDVVS